MLTLEMYLDADETVKITYSDERITLSIWTERSWIEKDINARTLIKFVNLYKLVEGS